MHYVKPTIKSYSADDIIEEMGPSQNQYTTVPLNPSAGNSTGAVDGYIVVNSGDALVELNTSDSEVGVGDLDLETANGVHARTFVGFDISAIPAGSTIVSATLRLFQAEPDGQPFTDLGSVVVDRVNFGNDGIQFSDFNTSGTRIGVISDNTAQGYKTLDVTNAVRQDITENKSTSQFRLKFSPLEYNGDTGNDNIGFFSIEKGSNIPELVITYRQ